MPTSILHERRATGGILYAPDAVRLFPEAKHVIYNRVSTWSQAGAGKAKLREKTRSVNLDYWRIAPPTRAFSLFDPPEGPEVFHGVEEGKLSKNRKAFVKAIRYCREQEGPTILFASDLSRFIRSERYHRQRTPNVWPTDAEFQRLREITEGVVLATLLDPMASESERHSYLTKRTGKAGRPSKIDSELAMEILELFGGCFVSESGRREWSNEEVSLGAVAKFITKSKSISVSKSAIQRLLDSPAPGHPGRRWKDFAIPARAYRKVWEKQGRPKYLHGAFEAGPEGYHLSAT